MRHPKDISDRSALAVMFGLRSLGYELYVPFGENTRCDAIVDDRHPAVSQRDYHGDIDVFGVYCHETGAIYLVPIEEVGSRQASLRIRPTRNAQRKKIRMAADYEIGRAPSLTE